MLDQNIPTPLYEQLKNVIKEEIKNKVYRPGERMPSEMELEKKYKVSRITVRRAVKELCEEGLLIRKQGKGTFVLNPTSQVSMNNSNMGFHDSWEKLGKQAHAEILEKKIVQVKPSLAHELEIDETDEVIFLYRVLYTDEVPIMIDSAYIPVNRFPGIYEKLEGDLALFRLIREEYGGLSNKHYKKVLKVQKATKEMSRLLDCRVGDPMFDLLKLSYDEQGKPLLITISIVKGESTSYVFSSEDDGELNHGGLIWKV